MVGVLGSIGIGLVWGWLLVLLVNRPPRRRPILNLLAAAVFTAWLAWLLYVLTAVPPLIAFFLAFILAFSVHYAWLHQLRARVD